MRRDYGLFFQDSEQLYHVSAHSAALGGYLSIGSGALLFPRPAGGGGILENAISRTRMRSCIASNALAISIAGVVGDRAREAVVGDKSSEAAAGRASGVVDTTTSDADQLPDAVAVRRSTLPRFGPTGGGGVPYCV